MNVVTITKSILNSNYTQANNEFDKIIIAFYLLKLLLYPMKVLVWYLWYVEGGRRSPTLSEDIVKSTPIFFIYYRVSSRQFLILIVI